MLMRYGLTKSESGRKNAGCVDGDLNTAIAPSPSGSRHRTLTPAYVVGSNPTGAVYKKKGENMTNLEFIQTCTKLQLVNLLCNEIAPAHHCGNCVASDYCYTDHNGFIDWLDKESVYHRHEK